MFHYFHISQSMSVENPTGSYIARETYFLIVISRKIVRFLFLRLNGLNQFKSFRKFTYDYSLNRIKECKRKELFFNPDISHLYSVCAAVSIFEMFFCHLIFFVHTVQIHC